MSCYLEKGRGWKYNFVLKKRRYQNGYFRTKSEARQAEALRKEELLHPELIVTSQVAKEPYLTDLVFVDLVEKRLEYVEARKARSYLHSYLYMARRWSRRWGQLTCDCISRDMVDFFFVKERRVPRPSPQTKT